MAARHLQERVRFPTRFQEHLGEKLSWATGFIPQAVEGLSRSEDFHSPPPTPMFSLFYFNNKE